MLYPNSVLEVIPDTYLRFNENGLPIIQARLKRLSTEMAQQLIQACMNADLDALRLRLESIDPTKFEEWERDQCEHEYTIMRNIFDHRVNLTLEPAEQIVNDTEEEHATD